MANKADSSETRLSLQPGARIKKLIRRAAKKDGRSMNQWAIRVLHDAADSALKG